MRREFKKDTELQLVQHAETHFKAAVVAQDTMASSLLADLIMRDLNCDAIGARPSDLLPMLDRAAIDLVIINADINSRFGAGYQLAHTISKDYPDVTIVIMIEEATREATISALRAGARGLFNRQQSLDQFIACIRHVRNGSLWAGPEETSFLLSALKQVPALGVLGEADSFSLSTRELQVVRSAASGKTNKAIASELHLSEHTVKNYLFRAFEKLGVSSRVELLFYLTTHGRTIGQESDAVLD